MKTATLGELSSPKQWRTLPKSEMVSSGYRVYGANGVIGYASEYTHAEPTILVGCRGTIGAVHICEPQSFATGNTMALDGLDASLVDREYLARFLSWRGFADVTSGTSQPQLTRQNIVTVEVPLPSLSEQRRIAAILDQAEALRAKRHQVLSHLDSLAQSIFYDMFGDPARNPRGFRVAPIRSLAEKFSDGPFGSNLKSSHYVDSGVPVVRLQNIGIGRYVDRDRAFVSEEHYTKLSKHDCRPGDVLIATLGDPNLRACIQPDFLPRALNKADCIQFRTDPTIADPMWACWLLNARGTLALAASLAHGQTRTRIAMGQLRELQVPVPPLLLQREFASRVKAVSATRIRVVGASIVEDELFAALQSRAFRGGF